jgi:hypothetical protein
MAALALMPFLIASPLLARTRETATSITPEKPLVVAQVADGTP